MRLTLLVFIAFLFSFESSGQPCSICSDALKNGTKDEFKKETSHSLDETINTLYTYEYEYWESYSSSNSNSTGLNAGFKLFSLGFDNSSSREEKKDKFNKDKNSYLYSRSLAQDDFEKISQSLINKTPYNTFLDCVKATCGNGIFIDYETTGDNILITATWVKTSGPGESTVLKNLTIANATPIDFNFKNGITLKPFNSLSGLFKRDNPKEDVIVSFDFENFPTKQVRIKKSKNQNQSTPIGTIVSSILDFASFCSLNEIPSSGDNSELIWVPADGRTVTGSIYGGLQAKVPDLRGVFLRGLNKFDMLNNPPYTRNEQLDTDNSRLSNSFQNEATKDHTHHFPDNLYFVSIKRPAELNAGIAAGNLFDDGGTKGISRPQINSTSSMKDPGTETRPKNIAVFYYIKIN